MRLKRPAGLAGVLVLAIAVAAVTGTAFAYFTGAGAGEASAEVTRLSAPTIGSAVPAPGAVALSWSAVTAPGPGTISYMVTRDGGEPAGNCPGKAAPSGATSCTDEGLEVGTHTYTVMAKWRSWTAVSAPATAKVTATAPTHFVISAASSTPAAGAADNLTITAKDAKGTTATAYTGSHSLVFSGASSSPGGTAPTVANSSGTAKAFGAETAITFSAGVATVSGTTKNGVMKLYAAEVANVSVSDGSIESEPDLEVTVASGTATKLSLAAASSTPVAGAADDLTTTALDTYGNVATSYESSHNLTFSGASASPSGENPTVTNNGAVAKAFGTSTAITFNSGVATVSAGSNGRMRLYKSGSASIKVSDGSISSSTITVTTSPAAGSEFSLAASATSLTAGGSSNLTVTALDLYDNTATEYTGSHNLVFAGAGTSPSGSAPTVVNSAGTATAFGATTVISFTSGVAKVSSSKNGVMKLNRAETANVSVSDGTLSSPGVAITVSAAAASKLALTHVTTTGAIGSSCLFTCTVTSLGNSNTVKANVAVTDTLGNTVSALGSGHAVKITSTGGTIAGTPLAIPTTGGAETAGQFTYTSKSSGSFTDTITIATSEGTTYTSATLTASK